MADVAGSAARRLRAVCSHLGHRQPTNVSGSVVGGAAAASAVALSPQQPPPAADGLTAAELDFFRECGYLVIRAAAPPEACTAAVTEVWRLAGKAPEIRDTWYSPLPPGRTRSGTRHPVQMRHQADLEAHMVQSDRHFPAAWEIRTSPRIYQCFSQLWGTDKLWLNNSESPEAAQPLFNLKPPVSDAHPGWGGGTYLHWDASVSPDEDRPGLQIQGVLYLANTPVNGGGIRLIPGFHKRLESTDLAREWHARRQLLPDNGPGGAMDLAEIEGLPAVQLGATFVTFLLVFHWQLISVDF